MPAFAGVPRGLIRRFWLPGVATTSAAVLIYSYRPRDFTGHTSPAVPPPTFGAEGEDYRQRSRLEEAAWSRKYHDYIATEALELKHFAGQVTSISCSRNSLPPIPPLPTLLPANTDTKMDYSFVAG